MPLRLTGGASSRFSMRMAVITVVLLLAAVVVVAAFAQYGAADSPLNSWFDSAVQPEVSDPKFDADGSMPDSLTPAPRVGTPETEQPPIEVDDDVGEPDPDDALVSPPAGAVRRLPIPERETTGVHLSRFDTVMIRSEDDLQSFLDALPPPPVVPPVEVAPEFVDPLRGVEFDRESLLLVCMTAGNTATPIDMNVLGVDGRDLVVEVHVGEQLQAGFCVLNERYFALAVSRKYIDAVRLQISTPKNPQGTTQSLPL